LARATGSADNYVKPIRRLVVAVLVLFLFLLFILWRIDSPRAERFRAQLVDWVVPNMDWALVPVTETVNLVRGFQSYAALQRQNRDLRDELQRMKAWKEAALQLEQENAKLLDLNRVRLDPALTVVTGQVLADSGSQLLVGRISGVGDRSSRVLLLTDNTSRVPVTIQPSGQRAILSGDNSLLPALDFIEDPEEVRPGDRVISSGDGGVFPAGLLVGNVVLARDGRLRLRLAADYERLEFLRVLRSQEPEGLDTPAEIIGPGLPDTQVELIRDEAADG